MPQKSREKAEKRPRCRKMPLPCADAETLTELRAMPISMLASDDWPNGREHHPPSGRHRCERVRGEEGHGLRRGHRDQGRGLRRRAARRLQRRQADGRQEPLPPSLAVPPRAAAAPLWLRLLHGSPQRGGYRPWVWGGLLPPVRGPRAPLAGRSRPRTTSASAALRTALRVACCASALHPRTGTRTPMRTPTPGAPPSPCLDTSPATRGVTNERLLCVCFCVRVCVPASPLLSV